MPTIRYSLIVPALLVLCAAMAAAQPADVRISPMDPAVHLLRDDALFQSGASLGGVALVAWGTSVPVAGPDSLRNEVLVQVVRGGRAVGMPTQAHDSDARPFGVAGVVALADRFLVLWNDRRPDARGVHARAFDTSGVAIGPDMLLAAGGALRADSALWLVPDSSGLLLVWADTSGRYYRVPVLPDGGPGASVTEIVQADFNDTLFYDELPGARFVRSPGASRFIHADGTVDARPVADRFLTLPHFVDPDTSIAVLDTVAGKRVLRYYRSVFDTVAVRERVLPVPGFIGGAKIIIAGRDSAGRVCLMVQRAQGFGNGPLANLMMIYVRLTYNEANAIVDSVELFRHDLWTEGNTAGSLWTGSLRWNELKLGDRASARIYVEYEATYIQKRDWIATTNKYSHVILFDSHCRVYRIDPAVEPYAARNVRRLFNVKRAESPDSSVVIAVQDSVSAVRLGVPVPESYRPVPARNPVIADVPGGPIVVWERANAVPMYVACAVRADDSGLLPGRLRTLVPQSRPPELNQRTDFRYTADLHGVDGRAWVRYMETNLSYVGSSGGWRGSSSHAVFVPTDSGWVRAYGGYSVDNSVFASGTAYDPARDEIVQGIAGGWSARDSTLFAVAPTGAMVWRSVVHNGADWLVPINKSTVGLLNGAALGVYSNGVATKSYTVPMPTRGGPYVIQRLRRAAFLRCYPMDGVDSATHLMRSREVAVQEVSFTGSVVRSVTITAPTDTFDLSVYESQDDGTLLLTWGSRTGALLTVLNAELRMAAPSVPVSYTRQPVRHPSCVVYNGRLLTVWEDNRDGAPAIYGTWLGPVTGLGGGAWPPPNTIRNATIAPVPARATSASLRVYVDDAGPIRVDILDAVGGLVRTMWQDGEPGTRILELDLRGLAGGAYVARVRDPRGDVAIVRFMVLR